MKSSSYLLLSIVLLFSSIILFIFFLHYHHKKDILTYENLPEVAKEVGFVYIDNNENDINNFYSGVLSKYNNNNSINKKMLLFTAIIFFIMGVYFFIVQLKLQNKEIENDRKVKENRINAMKLLYKSTEIPIVVNNTTLRWTQNQTRQILTGALTYAQPKEYSLYINCTNIFDKDIVAIEFDIKTLNAFNEQISSFVVSTKKQLSFGESTECVWNLSGSFDINNTVTEVKRVMFSDGTIWNK